MAGRCLQCGQPTEWSPDVGSAVCTSCGTLADPSQSVLTSAADFVSDSYVRDFLDYTRPSTLKSIRSASGWDLAGQGKEARYERNKLTMHESIRSLAARLAHPGLAPRAQALFDLTMVRADLRWGRAAKLAAGASLAYALREAGKGDLVHDIAYLLSEPAIALTRALSRLLALLGLTLPKSLPTAHLPALTAHLTAQLSASTATPALPADTLAFLRTLIPAHVPALLRIAEGLYNLLALPTTTDAQPHPMLALPQTPLGPATLVLAMEGLARPPRAAPHAQELAAVLGARLGVGKGAVMERYRVLVDVVEEAARGVPWLAAEEAKGRAKKGGRAKTARRVLVARAVLDVVQFREELWRRRVQEGGRVEIVLDDDGDDGDDGDDEAGCEAAATPSHSSAPLKRKADQGEGHKRNKRPRTALGCATSFLLDPLSVPLTSMSGMDLAAAGLSLDHTTHLLAPDTVPGRAPTRLQLLASARGGEAAVQDDELFAEGELEGTVIPSEEAAGELDARARALWTMWGEEEGRVEKPAPRPKAVKPAKGKGRVNAAAMAKLLGDPYGTLEIEGEGEDEETDEGDGEGCGYDDDDADGDFGHTGCDADAGVEEMGAWRPPSPGGGGWEDRYDV